jgi:hypothetical protein
LGEGCLIEKDQKGFKWFSSKEVPGTKSIQNAYKPPWISLFTIVGLEKGLKLK